MATDTQIQTLIHKLEEGGWARRLKIIVLLAAVLTVAYASLFGNSGFHGLYHPRAFEEAEIAREIARGHGFSTKMIRPAALFQFRQFKGTFPIDNIPDTYHGPVWPTVLAPFLWLVRDSWEMDKKEVIYESDRVVAIVATVCFLLAVLVNYFLARRLFDDRLAVIMVGLLLVCDHLWQFSLSGLPQMWMLLVFSCAMYCMLRAVEIREAQRAAEEAARLALIGELPPPLPGAEAEPATPAPAVAPTGLAAKAPWLRSPLPWLIGAALLFSVLALTHALTIWIAMGAILFCAIYFRPIGLYAGIMLAILGCCYAPWMIRNYRVCGTPVGVSWYSGLTVLRGTETAIMRSMDPPLSGVSPGLFRRKIAQQTDEQLSNFYGYMGAVATAPFFFIALLHLFRRRPTAVFRWCILLCWLAALFGMALFGMDSEGLKANDLHVLFIPLATAYGLAFVLVLWSRLEIRIRLVRVAFMIVLFLISGHAFLLSLLDLMGQGGARVQWPPYIPPYVALLGGWTKEDEVIMSDMPWAIAWYADRKGLWVPSTINDFVTLNDWDLLKGRIVGLYLTPISGNAAFLQDIKKGDWAEWSPFIERTAVLKNFPLKAVTPLPKDQMCVFYADRDRWTLRED